MSEKIKSIFEEIKNLTLVETSLLISEIENFFGFDLKSMLVNSNSTNSTISVEEIKPVVEEKTAFNVILSEVASDKKISVLKQIRTITGLGLKESKEVVDNVPKQIKEGISKQEAENLKKILEESGAKVIIN